MSRYIVMWEKSLDDAIEDIGSENDTKKYESYMSHILSVYNTLIDYIDETAPLVFTQGLSNEYISWKDQKVTPEDDALSSKIDSFVEEYGPSPENFDVLAVLLFKILFSFSVANEEDFDQVLSAQMIRFIESYRRGL